jgi:hypothetical protein
MTVYGPSGYLLNNREANAGEPSITIGSRTTVHGPLGYLLNNGEANTSEPSIIVHERAIILYRLPCPLFNNWKVNASATFVGKVTHVRD